MVPLASDDRYPLSRTYYFDLGSGEYISQDWGKYCISVGRPSRLGVLGFAEIGVGGTLIVAG